MLYLRRIVAKNSSCLFFPCQLSRKRDRGSFDCTTRPTIHHITAKSSSASPHINPSVLIRANSSTPRNFGAATCLRGCAPARFSRPPLPPNLYFFFSSPFLPLFRAGFFIRFSRAVLAKHFARETARRDGKRPRLPKIRFPSRASLRRPVDTAGLPV